MCVIKRQQFSQCAHFAPRMKENDSNVISHRESLGVALSVTKTVPSHSKYLQIDIWLKR